MYVMKKHIYNQTGSKNTHQAAGHRQQCRRAFWAGTGSTYAAPHRGHLWSQTHPVSGSGTLHWLSYSLPPRPGCAASESLRAYSCPDPTASDYSLCREMEETKFHWMFEFTASINYNCQYKHISGLIVWPWCSCGQAAARDATALMADCVGSASSSRASLRSENEKTVKNIWLTRILKVTNKTLELSSSGKPISAN